jgi:beta-barrel assembly-enhancing protease
MRSRATRVIIGLVMALIAVFTYFTNTQENPVTGEKQHVSMTPEQEVQLGLESAPQMAQEFGGLYPDEKVQQSVKRVGQKLVNSTDVKNSPYKFDFHVLADDKTVNAFAVPGGQIFITAALLDKLKSEDQLAGVLGHEITHVIGRHSAEQISKQQLTQGLAGAAAIATEDPNSPGRNAAVAAYVANLIGLKYGRDDEIESDQLGVRWMVESGYKPEAMIDVMEVLKAAGGANRPSEFMSSHPDPDNRIERIKEAIAKYKGQ